MADEEDVPVQRADSKPEHEAVESGCTPVGTDKFQDPHSLRNAQQECMVMELLMDHKPEYKFMTRAAISEHIKRILQPALERVHMLREKKTQHKRLILHARDLRKV